MTSRGLVVVFLLVVLLAAAAGPSARGHDLERSAMVGEADPSGSVRSPPDPGASVADRHAGPTGQPGEETRLGGRDGTLTLRAGAGQPVVGRSGLPPGSSLSVRVQSVDGVPLLVTGTAVVDTTGRFRTVVDLSEARQGDRVRVLVRRNGTTIAGTNTTLLACVTACPGTGDSPVTPSAVVAGDSDALRFEAAPGQVVAGRTNRRPGRRLRVTLLSTGEEPFRRNRTAVVDAAGRFRTVLDLSSAPVGPVVVTVRSPGGAGNLTTARGAVRRQCEAGCTGPSVATGSAYQEASIGVIRARNGSVAAVPVRLGVARSAVLTVRGSETDYRLVATVRDGNGDGRVTVLFETGGAGRPRARAAEDELRIRTERGRLAPSDYRLTLGPLANRSATVATGLLVVSGAGGTPSRTGGDPPGPGVEPLAVLALFAGVTVAAAGLWLLTRPGSR